MDSKDVTYKYVGGPIDLTTMEKKFLKLYKQLSHLWDPTHRDYNNRYRRNEGYDALLPTFRQYMPKATRFHVRQKINILRSCYRKERRKHLASRTMDTDGNVVFTYIPTSWKFRALRFLDCDEDADNEMDVSEVELSREYEDEPELELVESVELDTESGNEEPDTSKIHVSPLYIENDKQYLRKRSHNMTNSSFTNEEVLEKEFNAVGANVACKLQRMNWQQRYHAELLINKVLIQGLKECLTEQTDLTNSWQLEEPIHFGTRNEDSKEDALDTNPTSSQSSFKN